MRTTFVITAAALLLAAAPAALAAPQAGTWELRLRAVEVLPDESAAVSVGGSARVTDTAIPEADITYFFDSHWAAELIAGTTKHSVWYNGSTYLGSAWLLPPTLTVQYHLDGLGPIEPYIGAGINYTLFYDKSVGALGKLRLTDHWGPAVQIGSDIALSDSYFLNIDVKKVFLSTNASFAAAPGVTAKVDIDPWLIGAGVGIRF